MAVRLVGSELKSGANIVGRDVVLARKVFKGQPTKLAAMRVTETCERVFCASFTYGTDGCRSRHVEGHENSSNWERTAPRVSTAFRMLCRCACRFGGSSFDWSSDGKPEAGALSPARSRSRWSAHACIIFLRPANRSARLYADWVQNSYSRIKLKWFDGRSPNQIRPLL